MRRHPLSIAVSLTRNPLQTGPMLLATLLAALGIATVVMLATSIARTALAPNDFLLGTLHVQPRGAPFAEVDRGVRARPESGDAFRVRTITVRGRFLDIELPFPIHVVAQGRSGDLLARYGDHIAEGRLPAPGSLEIALPVSLARARHLGVGDTIFGLDLPVPFRVVGLVDGPRWVGVAELAPSLPVAQDALIVFPRADATLESLEAGIRETFGSRVTIRHWTADPGGSERNDEYVADIALLLGFIVLVNAAVLATINGLLAMLYFRQRRREFVLLSVLGWDKPALGRRALAEIGIVVVLGWALGVAATWLLMRGVDALLFAERGISVAYYDPTPAFLTVPLAIVSILVSAAVITAALSRFDPIAHLQAAQ